MRIESPKPTSVRHGNKETLLINGTLLLSDHSIPLRHTRVVGDGADTRDGRVLRAGLKTDDVFNDVGACLGWRTLVDLHSA